MKIGKTWIIIASAFFVFLLTVSCSGRKKVSIETSQAELAVEEEITVHDNKLLINSDLYNISEEHIVFSAHGTPDAEPVLRTFCE